MPVKLPTHKEAVEILDEDEDLYARIDTAAAMVRIAGAFAVEHLGMTGEISFQELQEVCTFLQDIDLSEDEEDPEEVPEEEPVTNAADPLVRRLKELGFTAVNGDDLRNLLQEQAAPTHYPAAEEIRRQPLGPRDLFLEFGNHCDDPSCSYCAPGALTQDNVRDHMLRILREYHVNTLPADESLRVRVILEDPNTTFMILPEGVIVRGGPIHTCQGLN